MNPNSSNQFLYLRAIQGHSGENAVDPAVQDNVLLLKGFTEYIYHVGNANEVNSIIRSGLIPGGKSFKRERQTVIFTTVNPMDDGYGMVDTPRDLTKPRMCHTRILGNAFKIRYFGAIWSSLKRKDCNFTKRGHLQSFSIRHTACSLHWESGMYESTGWALPEGALNSESATSRAQIELAMWSTRSTKPRRKIILGTIKRFEKFRGNL